MRFYVGAKANSVCQVGVYNWQNDLYYKLRQLNLLYLITHGIGFLQNLMDKILIINALKIETDDYF